MRPLRPVLVAALLVCAAGLTACADASPGPSPVPASSTPSTSAVRFAPRDAAEPAVAGAATAPERAVQASRAFFAASPGVVLAPDGDRAAQQRAAATAQRLHVPLLLVPARSSAMPTPSPTGSAMAEPSASATADPAALAAVAAEARRLGARWSAGDDVAALPGLRRFPLSGAPAVPAPQAAPVVAVSSSEGADTAALASARAAGATIVSSGGSALPGATSEGVKALASARSTPVVLIGSAFGRLQDPAWAVAAARTGYQYPGGGQVPFDGRLFVALYGTPSDGVLGVLGRQSPPATIDRVEGLVDQYRALVDRPVAPMLEVIATVAAGSPTDDGDYSSEIDVSALEPYIDRAAAAGIPVVLDLQPGRSDFLTQAKAYRTLLEKPNVGLALDPEWRLGKDQKPLVQIGRVSADEVNRTSAWLADLVRTEGLPPKPFVLHQFRLTMLQDRSRIAVDRPELDVLIHVDGQGSQPDKQATWRAVRAGASDVAWGWKNFLEKDTPVLTPRQTIDRVHPTPDLITYQ